MHRNVVTNISLILLILLDTLQSATGATGLFSQGVTAVVHGCSVRALGPILGETTLLGLTGPLCNALQLSTLWSTPMGKIQTSSFQCNLY